MPASASNEGKGIKRHFLYQRPENHCGAQKQNEGGKCTQVLSCLPGMLLLFYGGFLSSKKSNCRVVIHKKANFVYPTTSVTIG